MNAMSPQMVPVSLPADAWIDALQEAMRPRDANDGAKTVPELAEATGISAKRIRVFIARLQREGRVAVRRAPRPGIDGRICSVPVYLIVGGADALHS